MARRTESQIEHDAKVIQKVSLEAKTMDEVAELTGLSKSQVMTSLKRHPVLSKRIKTVLLSNRKYTLSDKSAIEKLKANSKDVLVDDEPAKTADLEANIEEEQSLSELEPIVAMQETQPSSLADFSVISEEDYDKKVINSEVKELEVPTGKRAVIDTSICVFDGILTILQMQKKVLVSDQTVRELKKLKAKNKGLDSYNANKILTMVAKGKKPFISVEIPKNHDYVDENIIDYCVTLRPNITLFTSDKEMAALARGRSIPVYFFEKGASLKLPNSRDELICINSDQVGAVITYYGSIYEHNRLKVKTQSSGGKDIIVYSGNFKHPNGYVFVKPGDSIYIIKKKDANSISFSHFKVISNSKYHNSEVVFTARILKRAGIFFLPEEQYRTIVNDFANRNGF